MQHGRRLWLVTVAVGRYLNAKMPTLDGAIRDANRVFDVLRDKSDAPIKESIRLFNEEATRERILDRLRYVAREALESDRVVFWFGGHGHEALGGDAPMPDGMTRHLLPAEATFATAGTAGISTRMLADALAGLRSPETGIVLDCCHSGGLVWADVGTLVHGAKSRHAIATARPWQLAADEDSFTSCFCDALGGLVPGLARDGAVASADAFAYAQEQVKHAQEATECKVGASPIALTRLTAVNRATGQTWRPLVCYPLQPAPHFSGRETLRADLLKWVQTPSMPARVTSLVAMGGTGKTALAERVMADVGGQPPAGLMCWSFYENPQTEAFLRIACEYLTGESPTSAGGLLERLQRALTGDVPHLFVLDGLERVQAEGGAGRPRGELEDPSMRRFLRWLAAGMGTKARALVDARFPLVDLDDWKGGGHREERLDDLEPSAAADVLRGWGVKGDDAVLEGLAKPLHYHALSVAVLGSYVGKLWGGDASQAPTFDRDEMSAADPKAARLTRILTSYAEKLPNAERDLLARLSTFPRGVTTEFLGFLRDAGGGIAGALIGCSQARLMLLLTQLRDLGLIFRYDTGQGATFTAHPFLREYFRDLLGVTTPAEIHEAVRARLAPTLEARPKNKTTDAATLDRYEALIEHTRLAGRTEDAVEVFQFGMGHGEHLGDVLGEFVRGLRIVAAFAPDGRLESVGAGLADDARLSLLSQWGGFAWYLGDLKNARRACAVAVELSLRAESAMQLAKTVRNLATLESAAGHLPIARQAAESALAEAVRADEEPQRAASHVSLARALALLGETTEAQRHFAVATALFDEQRLSSTHWIFEAELTWACGDRSSATSQTQAHRDVCVSNRLTADLANCDTLLGLLSLPDDPTTARHHLDAAREYASRAGYVEVQLRCYRLAAEIARVERDFPLAKSEAEAGIHLADTCGFGLHAIDLRTTLARVHLDASDASDALRRANEALNLATHPECQYAWGTGDALHLCGVAHARLGQTELARTRLRAALELRERIGHRDVAETLAELDRLGG